MRVTIIGHGPSIKNAKLGSFIDSTDGYVIRLCNRLWQDPLNYGTRTDYVLTPIEPRRMEKVFTESKAKYETWIYSRWGFKFRVSNTKKRIARLQRKGFNPINCIHQTTPWKYIYQRLCQKMIPEERKRYNNAYFSKGTAAIVIAPQRISHIDELLLLGLDNLVLGTDDNLLSHARLYDSPWSPRAEIEHNYPVERQILDKIVRKYKIKLIEV